MKKIILGMIAAFALTSFGIARAEEAPAGEKPAEGAKEKKGGKKKKEKKAEGGGDEGKK
jgi:hypothetical protein